MGARNTTKARKRPAQSRSQATVDALLTATACVLAERGFARTTTNRIAEVAGVNIGTLYRYFPSKDALLGALIDRELEPLARRLERAVEQTRGESLKTAVRQFFLAALEGHRLDPRVHRELLEQVGRSGRLERVVQIERQIGGLLDELVRSRLRPSLAGAAEVPSFFVWPAIEALVHAVLFRRPAELDIASATEAAVCFLLDGILGLGHDT